MYHLCITEIISAALNDRLFLLVMICREDCHIDFFGTQMYNNYRKPLSECELSYYENDA